MQICPICNNGRVVTFVGDGKLISMECTNGCGELKEKYPKEFAEMNEHYQKYAGPNVPEHRQVTNTAPILHIYHLYLDYPATKDGRSVKCQYCGQWGPRRSSCVYCNAPIE